MKITIPSTSIFKSKKGAEAAVESLFRQASKSALAEEGCITFQLRRDNENPQHFIWTEEWENLESLHRHLSAPHTQHFLDRLTEYVETSGVVAQTKRSTG